LAQSIPGDVNQDKDNMNILLINVPSRSGKGGFILPLGLLYVGGIIERCGHKVRILDLYLDDTDLKSLKSEDYGRVYKQIDEFNPDIIGYGGIATSYGRTKKLAKAVRSRYNGIFQIAGGPLASVYDLLLEKAGIDLVFHGETEKSLQVFLDNFSNKRPVFDISGVSYLRNGSITRNKEAGQVDDLDSIPFPAYHLVDVAKYMHSIDSWLSSNNSMIKESPKSADIINRIGNKKTFIPIVASRGCTHRCFFCYRHVHGVRRHSVKYVIDHIKYLQKTYNSDGFQFCDELFNSDPEWVAAFCGAIEEKKLDIFYFVGGARVDKVNEKMLRSLKQTGCIEINYGHESGSDTILKEYRKGVTVQKNKEVTLMTLRDIGLYCPVQLVIGAPSETAATINETIRFLKDLDASQASLNYLIPLPETPSWQYVQDKKLISDTEAYLDQVAEEGGSPIVNLTGADHRVWKSWGPLIWKELQLNEKKKRHPRFYFVYFLLYNIVYSIEALIPSHYRRIMRKYVKSILRRK